MGLSIQDRNDICKRSQEIVLMFSLPQVESPESMGVILNGQVTPKTTEANSDCL